MAECEWWCPVCKDAVLPKEAKGCGQMLVIMMWLGILAVVLWLSAWYLANILGLSGMVGAAVAVGAAGVVVKLVMDKTLPEARRCPTCDSDRLQRLQRAR